MVFACVQNEEIFITIKYWGHPPDSPEITTVQLDARRPDAATGDDPSATVIVPGVVTHGIPEELRQPVIDDDSLPKDMPVSHAE